MPLPFDWSPVYLLAGGYVPLVLLLAASWLYARRAVTAGERQRAEAEIANTRLKRAETRAQSAEQARNALLNLLDSQVRIPLNGAAGALGLMLELPLTGEARQYAEMARRHADGSLDAVDDVLDAARLDAGTLTRDDATVDLVELADDLARSVAVRVAAREVAVGVAYGPGVPRLISSDKYLLRRVLVLALGQAALRTDSRGVFLHVTLVGESAGRINLRIQVVQAAPGSKPAAWLERADGVAMAVFRRLVDMLGGNFETEPIVAPDGTLKLTLPVGVVAGRNAPATSAGAVVGIKLLVVDDHAGERAILRKQLEPFGVMVVEAGDAPSALDCIELAKLSGRPYDAALIAEVMPVIDGATLARRIRELPEGEQMRLIATGAAGRDMAYGTAFDARLGKPTPQAALHSCLAPVAHGGTFPPVLEPVPAAPVRSGRQLHVLVIERNPVHQMLATMMLSREGHVVDVASTGPEAVAAARHHPPDVMLLDLALADSDGLTVGRRLRTELGAELTAPIISMAEPNAPRSSEEVAVGTADTVTKPIDKNQLFAAIGRVLGEGAFCALPPPVEPPAAPTEEDMATLRELASRIVALKDAVSGEDIREQG